MSSKEGVLISGHALFHMHNCATKIWGSYDWAVDSLTCLNKYAHRILSFYLAYDNILVQLYSDAFCIVLNYLSVEDLSHSASVWKLKVWLRWTNLLPSSNLLNLSEEIWSNRPIGSQLHLKSQIFNHSYDLNTGGPRFRIDSKLLVFEWSYD